MSVLFMILEVWLMRLPLTIAAFLTYVFGVTVFLLPPMPVLAGAGLAEADGTAGFASIKTATQKRE